MYLFKGVTMDGDDSANVRQRSMSASIPLMHRSASSRETLASNLIDSSRLRAMTGNIALSSKLPWDPAKATVASLPITWAATIRGLRQHRVDLARHDRRAGLQVGQMDLGQAGARTRTHPTDVVADLRQPDGDGAQLTRRL